MIEKKVFLAMSPLDNFFLSLLVGEDMRSDSEDEDYIPSEDEESDDLVDDDGSVGSARRKEPIYRRKRMSIKKRSPRKKRSSIKKNKKRPVRYSDDSSYDSASLPKKHKTCSEGDSSPERRIETRNSVLTVDDASTFIKGRKLIILLQESKEGLKMKFGNDSLLNSKKGVVLEIGSVNDDDDPGSRKTKSKYSKRNRTKVDNYCDPQSSDEGNRSSPDCVGAGLRRMMRSWLSPEVRVKILPEKIRLQLKTDGCYTIQEDRIRQAHNLFAYLGLKKVSEDPRRQSSLRVPDKQREVGSKLGADPLSCDCFAQDPLQVAGQESRSEPSTPPLLECEAGSVGSGQGLESETSTPPRLECESGSVGSDQESGPGPSTPRLKLEAGSVGSGQESGSESSTRQCEAGSAESLLLLEEYLTAWLDSKLSEARSSLARESNTIQDLSRRCDEEETWLTDLDKHECELVKTVSHCQQDHDDADIEFNSCSRLARERRDAYFLTEKALRLVQLEIATENFNSLQRGFRDEDLIASKIEEEMLLALDLPLDRQRMNDSEDRKIQAGQKLKEASDNLRLAHAGLQSVQVEVKESKERLRALIDESSRAHIRYEDQDRTRKMFVESARATLKSALGQLNLEDLIVPDF